MRELHNFTELLPEVIALKSEYKLAKKKLTSLQNKLRTISDDYMFLINLISEGGTGDFLELECIKLFKSAGFKDVRHMGKRKPEREDLQIWFDDCIFLVECKGINEANPPDKELNQIKRYIDFKKMKGSVLPVFGFVVVNYDKKKPLEKRNKTPFDKIKEEYAIASEYGVLTTQELIAGFLKLKGDKLTLEEFKKSLQAFGIIKFDVKE